MRLAKHTYLRQLLVGQDTLLAVLVYLLVAIALGFTGKLSAEMVSEQARLCFFVLPASYLAAKWSPGKLHGASAATLLFFPAKFSAVVAGFMLALGQLGLGVSANPDVLRLFVVLLFFALLLNRLFLRWWYLEGRRQHPDNNLRILVVGCGPRAQRLIATYRDEVEWEIEIVGMLDPKEGDGPSEVEGIPVYRGESRVHELLAREVIDEVVVCLPRSLIDNIHQIVSVCEEQAVCLRFMADLYDIQSKRLGLQLIGDIPMLTIEPVAQGEGKLIVKRLIDMIASGCALLLLWPVFLILGIAIKLDSPGPVFFTQRRVGLNKRTFPMLKLRSMHVDAETQLKKIEHLNEAEGPIFKMDRDPRITRIGRWLRRSSVDELPQLLNVFLGHMSMVGPRPMSLRDVQQFNRAVQRRRFSVRPGLACLREVSGRSRLTFEEWLAMDLHYIEHWSLLLDFKILMLLIPAVLRGEGAS